MSDSYYLKKIPQSEYRKGVASSKEDKDTYIDLSLVDLNIKDPALKKALKKKIYEAGQEIVKVLLPEEKHANGLANEHLDEIYERLGLQ